MWKEFVLKVSYGFRLLKIGVECWLCGTVLFYWREPLELGRVCQLSLCYISWSLLVSFPFISVWRKVSHGRGFVEFVLTISLEVYLRVFMRKFY